jgi:hypothetical protein
MKKLQTITLIAAIIIATTSTAHALTEEEAIRLEQRQQAEYKNRPKTKVNDLTCMKEWSTSSAAQTCTPVDGIEQSPAGTCAVDAICLKTNVQPVGTDQGYTDPVKSSFYVEKERNNTFMPAPLPYVKDLVNCNGFLRYKNCEN